MLRVITTPRKTGVRVMGDKMDLAGLYQALHEIVGEEHEHLPHEAARLRVLGLCYDIRHALMGDRGIEFLDNGLDADHMKRLGTIAPAKNVYLSLNVVWPEMIFVTMALNDFVDLYARKMSRNLGPAAKVVFEKRSSTVTLVRLLQSAVADCLKETVPVTVYGRMINIMFGDGIRFGGYATQYVDLVNYRYLLMDPDRRSGSLSVIAKRLAERGREYREIEEEILRAARRYNCHPDDVEMQLDFPETIQW